jgi:hypothetical protein
MSKLNWLWTDDKTGNHSDTTLRMWILFFMLIFYGIPLGVIILYCDLNSIGKDFTSAINFFEILGFFALGGGGLYAAKRGMEQYSQSNENENGWKQK